jgi:Ala-tRNA(Pro) deacylase
MRMVFAANGAKDYLIYALPGNAEADLTSLAAASASTRLRLATSAELERTTHCRFGELPPIGSIFGCQLILDARLLNQTELYFNAGRLDRSVILVPGDLVRLESPLIFHG